MDAYCLADEQAYLHKVSLSVNQSIDDSSLIKLRAIYSPATQNRYTASLPVMAFLSAKDRNLTGRKYKRHAAAVYAAAGHQYNTTV